MTYHDWRKDAALRPQPKRSGPDDWSTPPCLCAALTHDVLPTIPEGIVWEPSPGNGALVDTIKATGRSVVATTDDFLHCPVPKGIRILATNPPFNLHLAFLGRCTDLIDAGALDAVILLLRHDHLQSESRTPPRVRISALRRAAAIYVCPWRPIWIAGTTGNGRCTFNWDVWLRGYAGPPQIFWPNRRTR
jgi:hypothetical protein